MVNTIYGPLPESELEKREGFVDNDHEHTTWVEYWKDGELVHRSAHVRLKKAAVYATGETEHFGG